MSDRLIRLLRIIYMIQSKPGIIARELAERCETTDRTIYRDLELLSAANIPFTNLGHSKGYEFIGNFSMYPLDWTENEARAFTMLPSIIKENLISHDFLPAYEKVMATYQKEKRVKQDILKNVINVIQTGKPAFQEQKNNYLTEVIDAILSSRTLDVVYHTQSRNKTTGRQIDPYYLIPRNHQFYLIAFCHDKQRVLTFRLSRFKEVTLLDQTFEKNEFNLQQFLKNTWSIIQGENTIKFKVLFKESAARYVKEEELLVRPKLTEYKDGSLLFEVTLNHEQEFLLWLRQYGPNAEILEPVEYREIMRDMLLEWVNVYKGE